MHKILFVCHGNICRSPMAEFIFKDLVKKAGLEENFVIASAATSTEEIYRGVGNPVYPPAQDELKKHGLSAKGKRARQINQSDYDFYDLLICMDENNLRNMHFMLGGDPMHKFFKLLDFTDSKGDVADPWYTDRFDKTYEDIYRGCVALLEYLSKK